MTEKNYTPIIPGASPDNPIPTKQYDSAEEVHPNRQDYEALKRRREYKEAIEQQAKFL